MKKVIVEHCGRDYEIEIQSGPFKLFANKGEYYDGWTMPRNADPYSEPYLVVFAKEHIKRVIE